MSSTTTKISSIEQKRTSRKGPKPKPEFIKTVRALRDNRGMSFREVVDFLTKRDGRQHYLTTVHRAYHWRE